MARPSLLRRAVAAPEAPPVPEVAPMAAPEAPRAPEENYDHVGAGLIRDQLPPDPEAHIVTSIEADVAAETVRLEFLKLRPEVNSWLIELSEKRLADLTQV